VRLAELAVRELLALGQSPAALDDADLFVLAGLSALVPEVVAEVLTTADVALASHARRSAVALHAARYASLGQPADLLGASSMLGATTAAERRCSALALGLLASRHECDDEAWQGVLANALRSGGAEGEWVAAAVLVSSMSGAAAHEAVAAARARSTHRSRAEGPLARLLRGEAVQNEFYGPFFWRLTTALFARVATRAAFGGRRALLLAVDLEPTAHERRQSARELLARPSLRVRVDAVRARLDGHALGGWWLKAPAVHEDGR
jgi:hypothetical protein